MIRKAERRPRRKAPPRYVHPLQLSLADLDELRRARAAVAHSLAARAEAADRLAELRRWIAQHSILAGGPR